jgi:type II secretory ATPase GspE/PulE/Tfp pilus assembly ATPase PilB-like protein
MLSTIHTNSAIDTIFRLKNFGVKDYLINSSLNLILAQRLVKKLCQNCKEEKIFSESDLKFIKKLDPKI